MDIKNIFISSLFITAFNILYLMFFLFFYIIPNKYHVSIVLFIGYAVVIFGFFLFININHNNRNCNLMRFRFFTETTIKIILIIAIIISLFIPSISSPTTIILWRKVGIFNYVRAIIILIGCSFLPGANLYKIFFPENNLHERFKVESFLLKITLYPMISFAFIGISVLLLDQLGFNTGLINNLLILILFGLFILDLLIQTIRVRKFVLKSEVISISKSTFIILIISIGVLLISLGIHLGIHYLIPGDSWIGLMPTDYIGTSNMSPIKWGSENYFYPIFWSYIIYGFSILCGLPYFNTNALFFLFSYLFVTSVFILVKSILNRFEDKYAVLATILISIASGLFYLSSEYGHGILPVITFTCEFYFIYKSYSYLLLINALAFFINLLKNEENEPKINISWYKIKFYEFKILFLVSFFLILSYLLYLLPLLMGFLVIIIYCLFSADKENNFRLLKHLVIYTALIFSLIDIVMEFYLSSSLIAFIQWFFLLPLISLISGSIPSLIIVYSLFLGFILIIFLVDKYYYAMLKMAKSVYLKLKINPKIIYKFCLILFIATLSIEIIFKILVELFHGSNIYFKITFLYYLDMIYINIGFIGILAIYFSFYIYKENKVTFFILFMWIFISFLIASALFFLYVFESNSIFVTQIDKTKLFLLNSWFDRNWAYSIIPLCIITAIGLIKYIEKFNISSKFGRLLNGRRKKRIIKYASFSLLIFLTYSNLILAGIWSGNINNRPNEEEIELFEWLSRNVPNQKNFLLDKEYLIQLGILAIVDGRYYFIEDVFDSKESASENLKEIEFLIDNEVEYLLIHKNYLDGSSNLSLFIRDYLKPYFYNDTIHKTHHYRVCYAPYFD